MRSLTLLAAAAGLLLTGSVGVRAQTVSSASLRLSNSGVANAALANSGFVAPTNSIANVEDRHEQRLKYLWITSIFAMAAGTGADAATSWHKKESNPFWRLRMAHSDRRVSESRRASPAVYFSRKFYFARTKTCVRRLPSAILPRRPFFPG